MSLPLPYSCSSTNKTRSRNQQACNHCSPMNTIHSIARSVHKRLGHTDFEQILHRSHTLRSSKARSPNSLLHTWQRNHNPLTNGYTTPHTLIEILSWESFNGSSCIGDHSWSSIGFFPINSIISLTMIPIRIFSDHNDTICKKQQSRKWWILNPWSDPTFDDDDWFYSFKRISWIPMIQGLCGLDSNSQAYVYIFCFAFSDVKKTGS